VLASAVSVRVERTISSSHQHVSALASSGNVWDAAGTLGNYKAAATVGLKSFWSYCNVLCI
jgi:hypothetical protein